MFSELTELILAAMQDYGAWALGAATLISALGLPLPATVLLLAAGAFARQGVLDGPAAVALAALGAILGDAAGYGLGRLGGLTATRVQATPAWGQARGLFQRWGGLAIFLSRFALTPLAVPVNLLAGGVRYSAWRFLAPVVLGEILWVLIFGGLGFAFADQWASLSSQMSDAGAYLIMLLIVLSVALYWLHRRNEPATAAG